MREALQAWIEARRRGPVAKVAINLAPRRSPYGGGNQFVGLLTGYLRSQGYHVSFRLDADTDAALLIDGRRELTTFGIDDVAELKRRRPSLALIHRVNECDQRKGTSFMDELLATTNRAADYTVFVSSWLRDYHAERWFDRTRPHSVILSGADPSVFHPLGNHPPRVGEPFRIATHHWSDNPMKGFPVYEEIDRRLAGGELPGMELWVMGRWPSTITWRKARLFPPMTGRPLADRLRQCHGYVTASRWEPAGMHFLEGTQCGLPPAYHLDGGGTPEYVAPFGVGFRENVAAALRELRDRYGELRLRLLQSAGSGDLMCVEYRRLIQQLVSLRSGQA